MKTKKWHIISILILAACTVVNQISFCSATGDYNSNPSGEEYIEKLQIITDRNTYIAGEEIFFSIANLSDSYLKQLEWSKVVYLELLTMDNRPVRQIKYSMVSGSAEGSVDIPVSVASGMYYLRAYTRWMRNYPVEEFAIQPLRIINPARQDMAAESDGLSPAGDILRISEPEKDEVINIDLSTDKNILGNREEVVVKVPVPVNIYPEKLCITVARKEAVKPFGEFNCVIPHLPVRGEVFMPETRGLSLSGKVVDRSSGGPAPHSLVHLSLIGNENDYFGYQTLDDGRFYFALPDYTGDRDLFVTAETGQAGGVDILVDQDFSGDNIHIKDLSFRIEDPEKAAIREMMVNAQVNKEYSYGFDGMPGREEDSRYSNFYGEPAESYLIDDYIELPTLEEFIFELIPGATVWRRGDRTSIMISRGQTELNIYHPLILLDHIVISDLETILKVSPSRLSRIDLVDSYYIRGNLYYGGVLSILSENSDLAGIDLPADSYFFNYRTFSPAAGQSFPDYSEGKGDPRIPDFRNTLYWDPDLGPPENGRITTKFFTSDRSGQYVIILRGYTTDGTFLYGESEITVK